MEDSKGVFWVFLSGCCFVAGVLFIYIGFKGNYFDGQTMFLLALISFVLGIGFGIFSFLSRIADSTFKTFTKGLADKTEKTNETKKVEDTSTSDNK